MDRDDATPASPRRPAQSLRQSRVDKAAGASSEVSGIVLNPAAVVLALPPTSSPPPRPPSHPNPLLNIKRAAAAAATPTTVSPGVQEFGFYPASRRRRGRPDAPAAWAALPSALLVALLSTCCVGLFVGASQLPWFVINIALGTGLSTLYLQNSYLLNKMETCYSTPVTSLTCVSLSYRSLKDTFGFEGTALLADGPPAHVMFHVAAGIAALLSLWALRLAYRLRLVIRADATAFASASARAPRDEEEEMGDGLDDDDDDDDDTCDCSRDCLARTHIVTAPSLVGLTWVVAILAMLSTGVGRSAYSGFGMETAGLSSGPGLDCAIAGTALSLLAVVVAVVLDSVAVGVVGVGKPRGLWCGCEVAQVGEE
jgi:hypothetical protein